MDQTVKPTPKTKRGRERRAQILAAAEEVFVGCSWRASHREFREGQRQVGVEEQHQRANRGQGQRRDDGKRGFTMAAGNVFRPDGGMAGSGEEGRQDNRGEIGRRQKCAEDHDADSEPAR